MSGYPVPYSNMHEIWTYRWIYFSHGCWLPGNAHGVGWLDRYNRNQGILVCLESSTLRSHRIMYDLSSVWLQTTSRGYCRATYWEFRAFNSPRISVWIGRNPEMMNLGTEDYSTPCLNITKILALRGPWILFFLPPRCLPFVFCCALITPWNTGFTEIIQTLIYINIYNHRPKQRLT